MRKSTLLLFLIAISLFARGQETQPKPYSLLIRNGYLIDPKNDLLDTLDIAIEQDHIARIAKYIDPASASMVIDASGSFVTPGLIDIHTHVFFGNEPDKEYAGGPEAVIPDSVTLCSGVTTIVDAGSAGYKEFALFKKRVIDPSRTRVLAFLNIVGAGMQGSPYEQDTADMNAEEAAATAKQYPNDIVGFKVAHYEGSGWFPIDAAVTAGRLANKPVMVDFGGTLPPKPISELFFDHLRPGDIFTHCFAELQDREPLVDPATRHLKPFVKKARQKGIVFDVGSGEISFTFSQAIPALRNGFLPNSISTDIHVRSNPSMKFLPDILSVFLAMGVDLPTVIRLATWNPALEIGRKELGHLTTGAIADITILRVRQGHFIFTDHTGHRIEGARKLECIATIKDGRLVYPLTTHP